MFGRIASVFLWFGVRDGTNKRKGSWLQRPHLLAIVNHIVQPIEIARESPIFKSAVFEHTLDKLRSTTMYVQLLRINIPKQILGQLRYEFFCSHLFQFRVQSYSRSALSDTDRVFCFVPDSLKSSRPPLGLWSERRCPLFLPFEATSRVASPSIRNS